MPVSRFRFLNKNSYETNHQLSVTFSAQASQPSVPQAEIWQSVTHQITDVGIIKGKTHHYYTLGEFSSTFALLEYLLVNILIVLLFILKTFHLYSLHFYTNISTFYCCICICI